MQSFPYPKLLNIEVTTHCPFSCSQCYCKKQEHKDIDIARVNNLLLEARKLGIEYVNISGGETLLYPRLHELISFCSQNSIKPNIAISGFNFTSEILTELMHRGIYRIFVSLNGATEKINVLSRQGYQEALAALKLLKQSSFYEYAINFVVSKGNIHDLPQMLELAKEMKAKYFYLLMEKPNKRDRLGNVLDKKDIEYICSFYKSYNGNVQIIFDNCFVQLNMMYKRLLLAAENVVGHIGCPAGKLTASINADGSFSSCRHARFSEYFETFEEYWKNSEALRKIQTLKPNNAVCGRCDFITFCKPCHSILELENRQELAVKKYCPLQR